MTELLLHMSDGTAVAVPASLESEAAYVLLEQQDWYEKELAFLRRWLKPGMVVADLGAGVGIYTLPLARAVGAEGRVFALHADPLLARGIAANGLANVVAGKPDRAPNLVRIAAGGARVLDEAWQLFERAPLVMFAATAEAVAAEKLPTRFAAMGWRVFRLLPGGPLLAPIEPNRPFDPYERNLFACTPERAQALEAEGLLATLPGAWQSDDAARAAARALVRAQPFAQSFTPLFTDQVEMDPAYLDALAAYAAWRSAERPPGERCAALWSALIGMAELCRRAPSFPRLSSLARIAWEAGEQRLAQQALSMFLTEAGRRELAIAEPFWPASPRYDALSPEGQFGDWFIAAVAEQKERLANFSSFFDGVTADLDWLCGLPFASAEMDRRRVLAKAKAGEQPEVPERLRTDAPDHLDAGLWASGGVPGTRV